MKTVKEASLVYIDNLIDLYCRVFLLKNNLHIINSLAKYKSKISNEFIVDQTLKTVPNNAVEVFNSLNFNIKEKFLENFKILTKNSSKYSKNNIIDTSDCELAIESVNFSLQKFQSRFNIERYFHIIDSDIEEEDFKNRADWFKNKVNPPELVNYFAVHGGNQYSKYLKSLKMGVRINYIINDDKFKDKFNIDDLRAERSPHLEKNWILFNGTNNNDFLFSLEISKVEGVNLLEGTNTDQELFNLFAYEINNSYSSNSLFDAMTQELLINSSEKISNVMSFDVKEIVKYIKEDIQNKTIKNILDSTTDFDSLCFDILALIKKYQNYKEF